MRNTDDRCSIRRKCAYCGEPFYINHNNVPEAIYYKNDTYHYNCFLEHCKEKSNAKRSDVRKRWTDVLNDIDIIKKNSYSHFLNVITKDKVYQFIQSHYDTVIVPKRVWLKIDSIYSGTYKGMMVGIPPVHLLDMWERKIDMLNRIAETNKIKGKTMTVEQRLSYDLSVLINKYDSYLKWLEKQKIIEVEQEFEKTENIISASIMNTVHQPNAVVHDDINDDISRLVDDIFD